MDDPLVKTQGETGVFTCTVQNPETLAFVDPTSITIRLRNPSKALVVAVNDAAAETNTGAGPGGDDTGHFKYQYPFAADAEVGAWTLQFKVTDGGNSRVTHGVSEIKLVDDAWATPA
jgi:hypothetical protein